MIVAGKSAATPYMQGRDGKAGIRDSKSSSKHSGPNRSASEGEDEDEEEDTPDPAYQEGPDGRMGRRTRRASAKTDVAPASRHRTRRKVSLYNQMACFKPHSLMVKH